MDKIYVTATVKLILNDPLDGPEETVQKWLDGEDDSGEVEVHELVDVMVDDAK